MKKTPMEAIIETIEIYSDMSIYFDSELTEILASHCEELINETCDSECPHCGRPLNLPGEEQIESWLRGNHK